MLSGPAGPAGPCHLQFAARSLSGQGYHISSAEACPDETLVIGLGARKGDASALPPSIREVPALQRRRRLLLQAQWVQANLEV